jgi:hypothetical protein
MTLKQFIYLLPRLVKYNLKIIFAGKFIWFLLAAFLFFQVVNVDPKNHYFKAELVLPWIDKVLK